MMPLPALDDLGNDRLALVQIVMRHCLMPHPDVVAAFPNAVFPSIRNAGKRGVIEEVGGRELLFDDNTTPRWAMLWAHGIRNMGHPRGWTFAHVWPRSDDPDSYTHLANLCMLPEFFGSLTDKVGPLCDYLRFHAWSRYGWSPESTAPAEPSDFASLQWRYLDPVADPRAAVRERLSMSKEKRAVSLLGMMLASNTE